MSATSGASGASSIRAFIASGRQPPTQLGDHLGGLGKAVRLVLRENPLLADEDVEDAPLALHQLDREAERRFDLGRQTGGPRAIVSDDAVFDADDRDDRDGGETRSGHRTPSSGDSTEGRRPQTAPAMKRG